MCHSLSLWTSPGMIQQSGDGVPTEESRCPISTSGVHGFPRGLWVLKFVERVKESRSQSTQSNVVSPAVPRT